MANVGSFQEEGFTGNESVAYLCIGYRLNRELDEPGEGAKKKLSKETFALHLVLDPLNNAQKDFHLFGTRQELEEIQGALPKFFSAGKPVTIYAPAEEDVCLPWWWND